ncbi:hypothetical protein CB1_000762002 [Camelus ferus]|nr:hypothetical protein CB1_000762002 [Camelus ferus]
MEPESWFYHAQSLALGGKLWVTHPVPWFPGPLLTLQSLKKPDPTAERQIPASVAARELGRASPGLQLQSTRWLPRLTLTPSVLRLDKMRVSGLLRLLSLISVLVVSWFFVRSYISSNMINVRLPRWIGSVHKENPGTPKCGGCTYRHHCSDPRVGSWLLLQSIRAMAGPTGAPRGKEKGVLIVYWGRRAICAKRAIVVKTKCGLSKSCSANFFAFKISSGAANVVGPSMCFEGQTIMSPVKNNVGRGLNIALVNGTKGTVLRHGSFDMYSGDPNLLVKFLKEIPDGTLVLVASYDDPGTKMNDEIRKLLSNLGSSYAKQLGFRDSWVFLGAKGLKSKSPFEEFLKNSPDTNKYDGWPELLELEGCVPQKKEYSPQAVFHNENEKQRLNGSASMYSEIQRERADIGGLMAPPEYREWNPELIKPKKLLNPVKASRSHQELHRELLMNHRRGLGVDSKPELQRVLEHRRRNQLIKKKKEELEAKRLQCPFEQELLRRQQRLNQLEKPPEKEEDRAPEFIKVRENLRRIATLTSEERAL